MTSRDKTPGILLSAALIVRDEEDVIRRCLESLEGLADEVVVLDTGSVDATPDICASLGARVIRGDWYDDFGRSRNECLSHCLGRWALIIDADEVITHSARARLRQLLRSTHLDALQVTVDSYSDDGGTIGVSHQSVRLLRRRAAHYEGRLHEQVRSNRHPQPLKLAQTDLLTMGHWGYVPHIVAARGKTDRNIRIAERSIAEGAGLRGEVDLGRTLAAAGRVEEALVRFDRGRAAEDLFVRRAALKQGVDALLNADRPQDAAPWLEELRACTTTTGSADLLAARMYAALDQPDEAVRLLERNVVHEIVPDDDGLGMTRGHVHALLGDVLQQAGRDREALTHLLAAAADGPHSLWPTVVELAQRLDAIPQAATTLDLTGQPDRARLALAEIAGKAPPGSMALVQQLHVDHGDHPMLVAVAPMLSDLMTIEQAVEWSARARAAGLADHCPLLKRGSSDALSALDRVASAGVLVEVFGDPRGLTLVEAIAAFIEPDDFHAALGQLDELAPTVLGPFVRSAASTTHRCLGMAKALDGHGERETALNVLEYGLALGGDADATADAQALHDRWTGSG